MLVNIILHRSNFISGITHGTLQKLLVLLNILLGDCKDLLQIGTTVQPLYLMIQLPLLRELIFLKKLLDHIGKNKFHIHGRETGIILIFLHQTLKMLLQLLHIFAGNVFGNLLHQTGILCLRIHRLAVRGLIIKHMHIWMIKFLLHGLLQLGHNFRQRLMPFKPAAHCKVKTCRVILLQNVI